jgi:hypothetical protein
LWFAQRIYELHGGKTMTAKQEPTCCPSTHSAASGERPISRQAGVIQAVRAHLKATRTRGQARANTTQIAEALSLPRRAVDRALLSLKERGVKVAPKR